MLFIHQYACISAQDSFPEVNLDAVIAPVDGKLFAREPAYDEIPKGILRRMSKPVRMAIGAASVLLKTSGRLDGIIGATANAGMDDCFRFLQQIIQYEEGLLTPGNFVQSTPNAMPAQVSMMTQNHGYNMTHVHLGLAFENALIDASMLVDEYPGSKYLLGTVDDISAYNYNINRLGGWYKELNSHGDFYNAGTTGSLPGEGAAMFIVSSEKSGSIAGITAAETLHTEDAALVVARLQTFLSLHLPNEVPDLLLSGENGDQQLLSFYEGCEQLLPPGTGVLRYKHLTGEFPTANALGLWFGCYILQHQRFPAHMVKVEPGVEKLRHILIYNNFKGLQHSFILLSGS
ncbi:MAG: beta-ketoacyl synthase chain length factor [Bacteroidota bacterium]